MVQESVIDVVDKQLANALQIFPRISWMQLGKILGYDPTTLARRWTRLRDAGLAWTVCYQQPEHLEVELPAMALVEVDVRAGQREQVVAALTPLQEVIEIARTSGSRDLLLTVVHASIATADAFISESIASIPGIRATRTRFVQNLYKDGARSHLDVLAPDVINALRRAAEGFAGEPSAPTPLLVSVMQSLLSDARRPASEIAAELGLSTTSVTRAIHRLFGSPWFTAKTDFAHHALGYTTAASLWYRVPTTDLGTVGASIAEVPGVRLSAAILDRMNLAITVWLHHAQDLESLLTRIENAHPRIELCETWLIPSVAKRSGAVLTQDGRFSHQISTSHALAPIGALPRRH
ncbi:Lrp/AsnC ligand binding domain-containing protein [Nocardioides sp. NBC_00163]|uniref:Lrp/AsnC family transcriptional regulator n=1 Tax=Nocardioides sp. NBC_00163 TaxID=2975999 RepID=UPI003245524D